MRRAPLIVLVLALGFAVLSIAKLESGRAGLVATDLAIGSTPATVWRQQGEQAGPLVVIAHGFAGSRQLMLGFAQTLARAGYITISYDLAGHGRNPVPMSGDVTSVDGTTRLLVEELDRVIDAGLALPGAGAQVAVIGHSMASDIVVRQAINDPRVAATVAVSMFSTAVTATEPRNLLIINGGWETALAAEAQRVMQLTDPAQNIRRRAVLAPHVEHLGVLFSPTTLAETRDWLNAVFGRDSTTDGVSRGGWIALLLVSVTALAWPLARLLSRFRAATPPTRLSGRQFWAATLVPMIVTPLLLWPFQVSFLPVLVADYLAVHFAVFGVLGLMFLARTGTLRSDGLALALPVALFGIVVFGGVLDRYFASFLPNTERLWIILAIAIGAIPFMVSDAFLTEGGRAPLWRVLVVRGSALLSLGIAVALNLEGLFFLLIILPVILLFFLLFGTVGGWVGRATWRPVAAGVGLGIFLGWALGVTFPLFAA